MLLENSCNDEGVLSDVEHLSSILTTATLFGSEAVLKYLLEKRQDFRPHINSPTKAVVHRYELYKYATSES